MISGDVSSLNSVIHSSSVGPSRLDAAAVAVVVDADAAVLSLSEFISMSSCFSSFFSSVVLVMTVSLLVRDLLAVPAYFESALPRCDDFFDVDDDVMSSRVVLFS